MKPPSAIRQARCEPGLFETASAPFLGVSMEGHVSEWNRKVEVLRGCDVEGFVGAQTQGTSCKTKHGPGCRLRGPLTPGCRWLTSATRRALSRRARAPRRRRRLCSTRCPGGTYSKPWGMMMISSSLPQAVAACVQQALGDDDGSSSLPQAPFGPEVLWSLMASASSPRHRALPRWRGSRRPSGAAGWPCLGGLVPWVSIGAPVGTVPAATPRA